MSKIIEKVCSNVLTSIRKNAIILQTNKQTNKQTKVLCALRREVRLFSFNCTPKAKGGNGLIHCSFSVRGVLC